MCSNTFTPHKSQRRTDCFLIRLVNCELWTVDNVLSTPTTSYNFLIIPRKKFSWGKNFVNQFYVVVALFLPVKDITCCLLLQVMTVDNAIKTKGYRKDFLATLTFRLLLNCSENAVEGCNGQWRRRLAWSTVRHNSLLRTLLYWTTAAHTAILILTTCLTVPRSLSREL